MSARRNEENVVAAAVSEYVDDIGDRGEENTSAYSIPPERVYVIKNDIPTKELESVPTEIETAI